MNMKSNFDKAVAIIGGGPSQLPFLFAAKEEKLKTFVFDRNPSCPAASVADCFFPISTHDADQIVEALVPFRDELVSCFTYSSFYPAQKAVVDVNEYFNLVGLKSEPLMFASEKYLFRDKLHEVGLLTPKSVLVKDLSKGKSFASQGKKIIVKPAVGSCGSAGVDLITDPVEDYVRKSKEASSNSADGSIILEEYIDGVEYTVDGFVDTEGVKIILVSKKFTLGPEYGFAINGFISDTEIIFNFVANYLTKIKKAIAAVRLSESFFSFDVIVSGQKIYFIDFGCLLDAKIDILMEYAGAPIYGIPSKIAVGRIEKFGFMSAIDEPIGLRFAYLKDNNNFIRVAGNDLSAHNGTFSFMCFDNAESVKKPPQSVADSVGAFLSVGDKVKGLWSVPWASDLIYGC